MADQSRLEELRRRVQRDPASLAFAQLAEEYRRAGSHQDAVRVSRAGLRHHPEYHSARVTLGRALLAAGELDAAARELGAVLRAAPENLAACRALGEVCLRGGRQAEALAHLRRALAMAPGDQELAEQIAGLERNARDDPSSGSVTAAPEPVQDPVPDPPASAETGPKRLLTHLERWRDLLEPGRHP